MLTKGWMLFRKGSFSAYKTKKQAEVVLEDLKQFYPNGKWVLAVVATEEPYEPPLSLPTAEKINAFGEELKTILELKERSITVELLPKNFDCETGSFKVSISDGEFQGTYTACELNNAIEGARGAMRQARLSIEPVAVSVSEAKFEPPRPKLSAAGLSIRKK